MAQWKGEATKVFLVFALALAARIFSIDHDVGSLQIQEFFHLLAAERWLHDGVFRIADGYYPRASVFTWLVAQSMALAPGNILVARMPAIIAGSLLVASVFCWTRRFGNFAAWTAALLLCFEYGSIDSSRTVRFYSLQALTFWMGSIALYAAVYSEGNRRIAAACVAVAALALALHLQVTTLIGIAALGAWLGLVWIMAAPDHRWPHRAGALVLVAAAILFIVWLLRDLPLVSELLAKYRWSATWAAVERNNWLYYYQKFADDFGVLLYLLPVAAIVATGRTLRPALFCLTILIVTLALHSGAGMKDRRYISDVLPYFFIIWGLAAEPLIATIRAYARRMAVQLPIPRLVESVLTWAVIGIALASSATYFRTVRAVSSVLSGSSRDTVTTSSSWAAANLELRRLAADASVVVVGNDTRALYFIGGYDLMLNRTDRDDYAPDREFAVDPRTGGAAIATGPSIQLVIECYPSGLIVLDRSLWRSPIHVTNDAADVIETMTQRVRLQSDNSLQVYRWRHDAQTGPIGCAKVYRVAGDPEHVGFTVRR